MNEKNIYWPVGESVESFHLWRPFKRVFLFLNKRSHRRGQFSGSEPELKAGSVLKLAALFFGED